MFGRADLDRQEGAARRGAGVAWGRNGPVAPPEGVTFANRSEHCVGARPPAGVAQPFQRVALGTTLRLSLSFMPGSTF